LCLSPCHQKRVVEFGEWVCGEVLKKVPHRHFVFSIPKILRRYFLYDRSFLSELSRCVRESLRVFYAREIRRGVRFRGRGYLLRLSKNPFEK
jgi:hypothetical protein